MMKAGGFSRALMLQCATALVLFLPLLILGEPFTHSDRFNHLWVQELPPRLASGELYPRWVYQSFHGLGAPSFYFYPPMFYWVTGVLYFLSFGLLKAQHLIPMAGAVFSAASGLAMYALLREFVGRDSAARGAVAYQMGPYHLVDFYIRGAVAEYAAFVFVPLVVQGIVRMARRQPGGGAIVSAGYAGLLYSHLPAAVLFSSVVPAYALVMAWGFRNGLRPRAAFVMLVGAFLVLGSALAAAYVLPAGTLLPYLAAVEQWTSFHVPHAWFIWNIATWPLVQFNAALMGLALAMAIVGVIVYRGTGADDPNRLHIRFWAGVAVLALPLMLGLVPFYWSIGPIAKAQFPFRFLVVAEFAFVFSAALFFSTRPLPWKKASFALAAGIAVVAAIPLAYATARQLSVLPSRLGIAIATWEKDFRDSDAYLPPQVFDARDPWLTYERDRDPNDGRLSLFATQALAQLAQLPLAQLEGSGPASGVSASSERGQLSIAANLDRPARIVVKRFYFPSWVVQDEGGKRVAARPTAEGLLSFEAQAGSHSYVVRQELPPIARISLLITLAAAIVVIGLAARGVFASSKSGVPSLQSAAGRP